METETVELGRQFGAAALLVLLMTVVHALGLVGISKVLDLREDRLEQLHFDFRGVALMCGMALLLFALHILEIWMFAAFYMLVDAIGSLEDALYYSASAYATLGWTADYFPEEWRLIGALEALIGFLLIGWSTAFIVNRFNKLRE